MKKLGGSGLLGQLRPEYVFKDQGSRNSRYREFDAFLSLLEN